MQAFEKFMFDWQNKNVTVFSDADTRLREHVRRTQVDETHASDCSYWVDETCDCYINPDYPED